MKRWIAQFKICQALSRREKLSRYWRNQVDRSPELREFERVVGGQDAELHQATQREAPVVPAGLVDSILQAVEEPKPSGGAVVREPSGLQVQVAGGKGSRWVSLWVPAGAFALLLVLGYWGGGLGELGERETSSAVGLAPEMSFDSGNDVSFPTADALLADLGVARVGLTPDPLAEQLEALTDDARRTARFLASSIP